MRRTDKRSIQPSASHPNTRAPRFVRRTAALSPANPAPMITASYVASFTRDSPGDPLTKGDEQLRGTPKLDPAVEDIVAAALDAAERGEIDGAHDFCGDQ